MARRRQLSRIRNDASFRRRPGTKQPRSIVLIVCEGETELEYFEAARIQYGLSSAEVVLADDTGMDPASVVRHAEKRAAEPGGYEKIFCVFDRNGHTTFDAARDRIRGLANRRNRPMPIQEAIAIPCFEIWVLLHFEQRDAPFARCDDVIRHIQARHMNTYRKADAATARALMPRIEAAVRNGVWLEARGPANGYNPYTNVHSVLQHFAVVAVAGGSP